VGWGGNARISSPDPTETVSGWSEEMKEETAVTGFRVEVPF
jgi:hypothetical protein